MTEEKKLSLHEVSHLLCEAYNKLVDKGQVTFPLHDTQIEKIDSVVKTVFSQYYEVDRFSTPQYKAAAFFCLIIKDHPVTDGNKRLATLWLEIYTEALGLKTSSPVSMDLLAVSVENEKELELHELIGVVKQILF